jgi:dTDP-3,4-didehydro-2,6-dideoxy-alpha-D-glucose 3-reductase
MSILNIAVWTVGEHARRNILPAINKSESVNLIGIFTRNADVLTNQSKHYGCRAYNNSDDMLSDYNVEVVYIGSPNALHYEQVKQCLLNNKHVIVEKSALSSLEEAKEIVELAKNRGLVVVEAFMFLYHRQFHNLKELVKSEKYGKILFVEASFGFPHLNKDDIRYSKELAGGALNDAGAYTICAVLNLLDPDFELIFSDLDTEDGYDIDTSGMAIFKKDNIKAICKWAMGVSYKNEIIIWCENGHIVVNRAFSKPETYKSTIQIVHNGNIIEVVDTGYDNHFINMLDDFNVNTKHFLLIEQARNISKIRSG